MLLLLSGCSRSFWRQNADDNTYAILRDKSVDPRWAPPRLDLQPNPGSRFYDPYDPDCEPLPPDDPTAHTYMHWMGRNTNTGIAKVDQPWTGGVLPPCLYPQKPIKGWKGWHSLGETLTVENPQWLEPFGLTPEQLEEQRQAGVEQGPGIANMNLAQAIELSYIHSRDFQLQLEDLYLTALDLTFERFRFDVRYLGFGGRPSAGLNQSYGGNNSQLAGNARLGVSQLLPTGGQWIVEMANNTLWLFTGGNQSSTASVLSYSLVQPLALGAGRQVVLESLTQAERESLYAMRDFARFRQTFFVNVVSGGGFSSGAYFGLLRQFQGILNQRYNIILLNKQAVRLRALAEESPEELPEPLPPMPEGFDLPALPEKFAGRLRYEPTLNDLRLKGELTAAELAELRELIPIPAIQEALGELFALSQAKNTLSLDVSQLETQLARNRSQLLQSERAFQDGLDRYKFQLGLPPDFWMTLDLELLKPFELISPTLQRLETELDDFVQRTEDLAEDQLASEELITITEELSTLAERVRSEALGLVDDDWDRVKANQDQRLAELPTMFTPESVLADYDRDKRLIEIVREDVARSIGQLKKLRQKMRDQIDMVPPQPGAENQERLDPRLEIAGIRERLVKYVQNLEVIQVNLRVELIGLNKVELQLEQAVQTGLENRVDLMNQRARVMDARRQMEVLWNTLRSQVDVVVAGDIRTPGLGAGSTKPFAFRSDQSSYRVGLNVTAPLDQVAQRNNYRASLINYQQARRAYMQAEDQVKLDIRQAWRQLTVIRQTFEIARKNVRLAAMQYDQAVERTLAPATTGQGGNQSSNNGLNLLQALSSVLSAQNDLIQAWADYEANRLNIHRDMGIMQLDERGVWIDDYYIRQTSSLFPASGMNSPSLPNSQGTQEGVTVPGIAPVDSPPAQPEVPAIPPVP